MIPMSMMFAIRSGISTSSSTSSVTRTGARMACFLYSRTDFSSFLLICFFLSFLTFLRFLLFFPGRTGSPTFCLSTRTNTSMVVVRDPPSDEVLPPADVRKQRLPQLQRPPRWHDPLQPGILLHRLPVNVGFSSPGAGGSPVAVDLRTLNSRSMSLW